MISPVDIARNLSTTLNLPTANAKAASANTTTPAAKTANDPNDLANKEVFLQLLITQIKNQDPTKPADSIQYITQLSQFTSTEQLVDIKTTLKEIDAVLKNTKTPSVGTDPQ